MVELIDDSISPASIPQRALLSWSSDIKPSNCQVENDGMTANFLQGGGFRFIRSHESFKEGTHRFEVSVDFINSESQQISFGISHEPNLKCDCGVYYFTNSYIYCNYYPSFTMNYDNIHKTEPKKLKDNGGNIAINIDFFRKIIFWEIDGLTYEEYPFDNMDRPIYLVAGMFKGKVTII